MLIIFGMRNRVHQHGPCVAASCPRCHNQVVLIYAVLTRWFTLFFIPVIPIKRTRMLVCPVCNWRRDVPKKSEPIALEMRGITESWKQHQLGDDEYAKRVDAFWSFMSGAGADGGTPGAPGTPEAPGTSMQAPPPPSVSGDQPPAPPTAG